MSLIIAIEPDRNQAAQLKDLVRRHTGAELILADTTAHAIDAIEARVPDLILIPPFLSPEDDEALTAALRVAEDAAHIQTLTIPTLGTPRPKSPAQGVLARLRWDQTRPSSPDSCDPKLFAEQITEYLERVAKERGGVAGGNGKGSLGSNGSARQAEAVATPTPVEKPKLAAVSQAVAEPKVASPPPQKEAADVDVSALVAALSPVATEAPAPDASPVLEDLEGLEQGLSSLMEKLSAEDSAVSADATVAKEADPADFAELKELESLEYAMPKLAPHDGHPVVVVVQEAPRPTSAPTSEPAATSVSAPEPPPAPPAGPPATPVTSEWGDLMESLKKDLGR